MPDIKLTYTIPSAKAAEYIADYVRVHRNVETIPDPKWVDPGDLSEAPQVPVYTDGQWVKEHIKRLIRQQIIRGKRMERQANLAKFNVDDVT